MNNRPKINVLSKEKEEVRLLLFIIELWVRVIHTPDESNRMELKRGIEKGSKTTGKNSKGGKKDLDQVSGHTEE